MTANVIVIFCFIKIHLYNELVCGYFKFVLFHVSFNDQFIKFEHLKFDCNMYYINF